MQLLGRVALVTGAQQGIGRAIVLASARAGARVVLNYLDDAAAAERLRGEIAALGGEAATVQGSVAAAGDVARMIEAGEALGGIDVLVNNAGIFPRRELLDMGEDEWNEVLAVNLTGAFLCTRAVARALCGRGRAGAIVNIASVAAFTGPALGAHYAASKAGLLGLTRASAMALAPRGIRVNAIAPGLADTAQPRFGNTEQEIAARAVTLPLGRIIRPDEIAGVAVFLASDEAAQITGQTIHVNAGSYLA